ncbi:hypothetical protein FRB99_008722 [Tulasnella sp. 403]|nr:hypothetical protein FRB99_008722 [Tulasnella sp. 403]
MVEIPMLSRHTSNPLQAPSDDPANAKYLRELQPVLTREKNRGSRDTSSIHDGADLDEAMLASDEDESKDERTSDDVSEDLEEMDEEEGTLYLKDPEEQAQILGEIADLERTVPALKDDFRLIDRLGEDKDQVVAVMPYQRNVDFRQYFAVLPLPSMQSYFRCLLRALRDIHAREIVHRDVKPANFLFDPESGQGVLVDFGLAQRVDYDVETSCNHTAASKDAPHGMLKSFARGDMQRMRDHLAEARKKASGPSDRVGWLAEETRPHIKANRAGTRGFRAPEVLLKCEDQTGALDIWSVGTILLSFLSGKFPIFNANDDVEALMEITTILGKRKMEKCAQLHNRTFITNVPAVDHAGTPWREMVERLNPSLIHRLQGQDGDESKSSLEKRSASHLYASSDPNYSRATDPLLPLAYDLLEQMMLPDMTKRITARDALFHPFLVEKIPVESKPENVEENEKPLDAMDDDGEATCDIESREYEDPETGGVIVASGDDLYVPHPYGEGVCKRGHWTDEETGEQCCFVLVDDKTKRKRSRAPLIMSEPDDEASARRNERMQKRMIREAKLRAQGIFTLVLPIESPVDDEEGEKTPGPPLERHIRVRVKRLAAGEGIAIGLEPCEFHRTGVVDASYWHTHVRPVLEEHAMEGEGDEMVAWPGGIDDDEEMVNNDE